MPLTRHQFTLHTVDNLPENFVTNTWHTIDNGSAGQASAAAAIQTFYSAVKNVLGATLKTAGHGLKQYNMYSPVPRAPVLDTTWALDGSAGSGILPTETAICVSFQGAKISGVAQARRRGRIYLGPLATVALGTDGRVSPTAMTTIVNAAAALKTASDTSTDWDWVVYSTTAGGLNPIDETGVAIVNDGWVDNAFDTQRRRGVAATARTVF